ncbi:MAG: DUF4157 domain-containing protein [Bernardetiaceae bacterium]|nr:DUF4157 domain-containing protein [Bernardetiaceae bacterium]
MVHEKKNNTYQPLSRQRKAADSSGSSLMPPQSDVNVPLQRKAETGLPEQVQTKMESAFNTSFSDVKIHTNSSKASDIGAQAFTQGNNVHFAQAKFNPSSQSGQQLIGHELSHVVQQREGRVKPTTQMKGVAINNDSSLEREADVQGAKAARGESVQRKTVSGSSSPTHIAQAKPIQMMTRHLVTTFGKTLGKTFGKTLGKTSGSTFGKTAGSTFGRNFSKQIFPMVDAEFARRDGKNTIKEICNSFSEGNPLKGIGLIILNFVHAPKIPFTSGKYADDAGTIFKNLVEGGVQELNKNSYSDSNKSMDFTTGTIIDDDGMKPKKKFDTGKIQDFQSLSPKIPSLKTMINYYQANSNKMPYEQAIMLYTMIIQTYFALLQQSMHSEDNEDEYSDYSYLNDEDIKQ